MNMVTIVAIFHNTPNDVRVDTLPFLTGLQRLYDRNFDSLCLSCVMILHDNGGVVGFDRSCNEFDDRLPESLDDSYFQPLFQRMP